MSDPLTGFCIIELATLVQQLCDERTAQRRHVAGDFFNQACARFMTRASHD